ncbi:MAG: hypothetical protein IT264_00060 [Saprospiraceae bacterium]|nr:hypothetical protein [Saprospiraceae bacterium]
MNEIIEFRKEPRIGNTKSFNGFDKPLFKLDLPRGTFMFLKKASEKLSLTDGCALMFGLIRNENKVYLMNEEATNSSYILKYAGKGKPYFRFTSKQLAVKLCEFFEVKFCKRAVYFRISESPDSKGRYIIEVEGGSMVL